MIGVSGQLPAAVFAQQASDETIYRGRRCNVFRILSERDQQTVAIEAIVGVDDSRVQSIAVWPTNELGKSVRAAAPLAEIRFLARDATIDDQKFVIRDGLSADGRLGRTVDHQGLVTLRPATQQRWTPINREMILKPGDWLRTDIRGPHAVLVKLTGGAELTLGPGTLLELETPDRARIHSGELQVVAAKELQLSGPADETLSIHGTQIDSLLAPGTANAGQPAAVARGI